MIRPGRNSGGNGGKPMHLSYLKRALRPGNVPTRGEDWLLSSFSKLSLGEFSMPRFLSHIFGEGVLYISPDLCSQPMLDYVFTISGNVSFEMRQAVMINWV